MLENWKALPGLEGTYLVSDRGRVMSNLGHIITNIKNGMLMYQGLKIDVVKAIASSFIPNPNGYSNVRTIDSKYDDLSVDNIEWTNEHDYIQDNKKPVTLIKDRRTYEFPSITAAEKFIGCSRGSVSDALKTYNRLRAVNGFIVCFTEHKERIQSILSGTFGKVEDLEGEEWKPIADAHKYMVSNKGRIKKLGYIEHLMSLVPNIERQYLYVTITNDEGKKINRRVNRLVASAFLPNPNNFTEVDHINMIRTDNDVSNLEWVSRQENERRRRAAIATQ